MLVDDRDSAMADTALDPNRATLRPKLFWFNLGLTVAVMVTLVANIIPLPFVFMVGSAIALLVNFPKVKDQGAQLIAHAPSIVAVVSMVMAAAVLTGVLNGTGMVKAMSEWLVADHPVRHGPVHGRHHRRPQHPDDVLHEQRRLLLRRPAGAQRDRRPTTASAPWTWPAPRSPASPSTCRAPLVPAILLLVSLAKVDLGDHHKKVLWRTAVISLVMLAVGVLTGAIGIG